MVAPRVSAALQSKGHFSTIASYSISQLQHSTVAYASPYTHTPVFRHRANVVHARPTGSLSSLISRITNSTIHTSAPGWLARFAACAARPRATTAVRRLACGGVSCHRSVATAPQVGIGAVVLREGAGQEVEVLLIQRGKEPDKGKWTFPGGRLELGETMADCAAREVLEETGLVIRTASGTEKLMGCGVLPQLSGCGVKAPYFATGMLELPPLPMPFTAIDCIRRGPEGIEFHYTIVEMVAAPVDPHAEVEAGDDAAAVKWVRVSDLRRMSGVVRDTAQVAEEAVRRFAAS